MMPISELPMGIFDQSDEKRQLGPEASAATHLSKLEQKRKARKLSTMSGIMMDKWSTVQGKEFFFVDDALCSLACCQTAMPSPRAVRCCRRREIAKLMRFGLNSFQLDRTSS